MDMGYATSFDMVLLTQDAESNIEDPKIYDKVVELLREMDIIGYALDDSLSCYDAVNWYSRRDDMLEVSRIIPDVLFRLHGEGENNGDIWDQYFLNGKTQLCVAEIKIPPFDPDKLE